MSEKLQQTGIENVKQGGALRNIREKINLPLATVALSVMTLVGCAKDKETTEKPNQAPELGVSVKEVNTTNFVLNLDYTDDKEGGSIDYIVKDKSTGQQIGDGQISADKKTLYIGSLQPEHTYQASLEAIDSDGKETPKEIEVTTNAVDIAPPVAPTLNTTTLNIMENSIESVEVILTSEQTVNTVTVTGETASYLDLQSVERIGTTDNYTITLKPHDLDWDTDPEHLGGLKVETDTATSELTLNINLANENEPTPTLFTESENQRGDTGEYFVFKLEDSDMNWFYTQSGELMSEDEVETAINNPVLTGTMTFMFNELQIFEYMPLHANGVPYARTETGNIYFQDENEQTLKVMSHTDFQEQFVYARERMKDEGLEAFSNEDGFQNMSYFGNPLFGSGIAPSFSNALIDKFYTDWASQSEALAIHPKFITKFVVEKKLYNLSETE